MTKQEPKNPFYLLLVVTGVVFVITACVYGVVAVRELNPRRPEMQTANADSDNGKQLLEFMNHNGLQLLGGELSVLAVATVGAIWLDSVRQKRAAAASGSSTSHLSPH